MPAKRDLATELAEKMLHALEAHRDLDPNASPPTLRQLAERADPTADAPTVQKAVKKKPLKDRVAVVQPKDLDSPISLVEDLDKLAAGSELLSYLLASLCTAAKPTIDVAALKKKAPAPMKEAFARALDQRIAANALPPGVAMISVKKKPHLHLQRYPLPRKPEEALAEELLKVLQAQRQLGAGAYPITLARLIELTRPAADKALVEKATGHTIFKQAVVQAMKKEPETPLAFASDLELLADSPLLLTMTLQKAHTEEEQAFGLVELQKKVQSPLQEPFLASITRRATEGQLPQGVGRLMHKKKPVLFLVRDVVSGRVESDGQKNAPPRLPAEFAPAFDEAFERLDRQNRSHNFVSLLELRRGLPFNRQEFDTGLNELRQMGRYTLSAAEGRQGISPQDQDAGIIEDGALLLYVSRKKS